MQFNQFTNEEVPIPSLVISGGCIRFDKVEGVYLHTNPTHKSVGIEAVGIDPTNGHLSIQRFNSDPVVSITTVPDETLASKGLIFGPSGGARLTLVRIYDRNGKLLDLRNETDFNSIAGPTSNMWVTFVTLPN